MKFKTAALAAGILLLGTMPLHADKAMKKGMGEKGKMMSQMKDDLGLTDDQAAKMKAIHKENHEATKALRNKVDADLANLKVLVDKKASDTELSALIATLKSDHEALQAAEKKHRDAMQQILTPLQQAKMVIQMGEHRHGKGGMGGMMMGGEGMHGMHGHGPEGVDDMDGPEGEGPKHEHEHGKDD